MKYAELNIKAKKVADNIIELFNVSELVNLDKVQMGQAISFYVNKLGQDGDEFVYQVYEISTETNPLAKLNPPLWLLCSFLSTMCRSWIKKYGYDNLDDLEWFELAQSLVDKSDNPFHKR